MQHQRQGESKALHLHGEERVQEQDTGVSWVRRVDVVRSGVSWVRRGDVVRSTVGDDIENGLDCMSQVYLTMILFSLSLSYTQVQQSRKGRAS